MAQASKSSAIPPASTSKKIIVRNCESLPTVLKEDELSDRSSSTSSADELDDDLNTVPSDKKSKSSYAQPRLYSSVRLAQSLKNASEQKCKQLKVSQQSVKPKNLKKINVPFEEKLFKGLVDLKVTEEDIGIPPVAQSLKPKEIAKQKEPEPALSDFFKPDFSKEYVVRPNPPEFEIKSEYYFTGDQVWKAIKQCEPDPSTMFQLCK